MNDRKQRTRRRLWILPAASLAGMLGGCGVTLEDGYRPKPIDSSPEVRRSYYASPFTDEANATPAGKPAPDLHGGR